MFKVLWVNGSWRALMAGVAYMLLYALGSLVAWWGKLYLEHRTGAGAVRLRRWKGWSLLGQALRLGFAVAYLYGMLLGGVFASSDVGLQAIDWPIALPWLVSVTLGSALWLGVLWGSHLRKLAQSGGVRANLSEGDAWSAILTTTLRDEAACATFRGALIPIIGLYWGVWLAALWQLLTSRLDPALNARLRLPGMREAIFLDWALDWVGAVLFILSGHIGAALVGRAFCRAVVLGIARLTIRRNASYPTAS